GCRCTSRSKRAFFPIGARCRAPPEPTAAWRQHFSRRLDASRHRRFPWRRARASDSCLTGEEKLTVAHRALRGSRSMPEREKMRKKNRRGTDKVIHVVFGPGGGRVEPRAPRQTETAAATNEVPDSREPITDLFSGTEVSRLLGLSTARLR